jgi:hypothetical protein
MDDVMKMPGIQANWTTLDFSTIVSKLENQILDS